MAHENQSLRSHIIRIFPKMNKNRISNVEMWNFWNFWASS